ncbi:MAG TPA: YetF domain-containing protein [Candidatus Dormibacteraeota bacterium]|nr:YetF domain-containing protein [Candidatus Dormibacteraeota bacterium]
MTTSPWHDILTLAGPWWSIPLRTAAVYLVLLIGVRITGKRQIGQMTLFDLVLLLMLSNAVQNAMTGPDDSVTGGVTAAAVLLLVNGVVSRITFYSRSARKLVEGEPTIVVRDGVILRENCKRELLTPEEIETAMREHGIHDLGEVGLAVLEIDGSISVIPKSELHPHAVPLPYPGTKRHAHPVRFLRGPHGV